MEIFINIWMIYLLGVGATMCCISLLSMLYYRATRTKDMEKFYMPYLYVFIIGAVLLVSTYKYLF